MKIDSGLIAGASVREAGLTRFVTRDTEKCPLSALPGVRIKRVNFRENIQAFCRDKRNCPYKVGVRRARFYCTTGDIPLKYSQHIPNSEFSNMHA